VNAPERHVVPYPFYRTTHEGYDEEGAYEAPTWRPGAECDLDAAGCPSWAADAMGEMILEVVGRFKPPGRYPERTFFVRQWRDPNGRLFGKAKLRITTTAAFARLAKGYRHEYELTGETEPLLKETKRLEEAQEEGWT
jgi:hypothetical protein